MAVKNLEDLNRKTTIKDHVTQLPVLRKVYMLTEILESKTFINTEILKGRKLELEEELLQINDLLSQMED